MTIDEVLEKQGEIVIIRANKVLTPSEIKSLSIEDLKKCDCVKVRDRHLTIIKDKSGNHYELDCGASFGPSHGKKETVLGVLESAYSLLKRLYW